MIDTTLPLAIFGKGEPLLRARAVAACLDIGYDSLNADGARFPPGASRAEIAGWMGAAIRSAGQDGRLVLSVQWPWRINPAWFPRPAINLHYSLLPRHRGMYPIAHAILAGDEFHGVTLHEIDAGWDTGPIIAQERIRIGDMDAAQLYAASMSAGDKLLREWLPRLIAGDYEATPQPVESPTGYHNAASIDFKATEIDPEWPADRVGRFVRAMHFPGKQTATFRGFPVLPRQA